MGEGRGEKGGGMVLWVLPLSEKLAGLEVNGEVDVVGLDKRELVVCNISLWNHDSTVVTKYGSSQIW